MLLKRSFLIAIAVVAINSELLLAKQFFRGRPFDGFVPKPPKRITEGPLSDDVTTANFTQMLDHFDPSENRTWQQVYQINKNVYRPGGPIFVMISGEAPIDISWMTFGQWYKNAKLYGALMFQLEHRFFGDSHPLSDASDKNLVYLTSDQALADLDYFIKAKKEEYSIDKVIVFGGSYAGNLAAWYREKYSTALGSIASSGPVTAELDFTQYLETVGSTLDYFVPGCYDQVEQAFAALQSLFDNENQTEITELFKPCSPALINFTDPYYMYSFFDTLINPWAGAVQYTAPDKETSEVYELCQYMTNNSFADDPIHRLSKLYTEIQINCIDYDYTKYIDALKETNWDALYVGSGTRQWSWLTCSEFAYYQSTDSQNQPFGQTVPVDFMIDVTCTKVFGQTYSQINASVIKTNNNYGGVNGQEKNVYLPNGSLDPWHNLAIYQTAPDSSDTLGYMNGTSHCYDMMDDLDTDPPQLAVVRYQITQQIGKWLEAAPISSAIHFKTSIFFIIVAALVALTIQ
jgi:pimeloyl-ACP methyl ester carboxylesterase